MLLSLFITFNCNIVFIVGDYILLCRLLNDPYDVMGCWCTDNYFISGTMEWDYNSFDASIWLCSPPTFKSKKGPFYTDSKRLLEAGKSNTEGDTTEDLSSADPLAEAHNVLPKSESNRNATSSHDNVVVSWYKKQLLKFRNLQVRDCKLGRRKFSSTSGK